MPFKPGRSGNPSGRPKENPEVKALCEKHTPAAIETLAEIMRDKKQQASARVAAAAHILRKTLPDLSSVDGEIDHNHRNVIRAPDPLPTETWEQKYARPTQH